MSYLFYIIVIIIIIIIIIILHILLVVSDVTHSQKWLLTWQHFVDLQSPITFFIFQPIFLYQIAQIDYLFSSMSMVWCAFSLLLQYVLSITETANQV